MKSVISAIFAAVLILIDLFATIGHPIPQDLTVQALGLVNLILVILIIVFEHAPDFHWGHQ